MTAFDDRLDEACAWAARAQSDDVDWAAFTLWLEDPENARAYDIVAALEGDIAAQADAIGRALPSNDVEAPTARRRWLLFAGPGLGAAIAVSAALAILPSWQQAAPPPLVPYATGAGEGRVIAVDDRVRIRLDRRTAIRVSADKRRVELAGGSAFFDVRHDPKRPFTVAAAGYEVRDVGTRFEVVNDPKRLSIAVVEGAVDVVPPDGSAPVSVTAGQRLELALDTRSATRMPADPAEVATWRTGQLRYQDAPLALVAADVTRYAGKPIIIDSSATGLRFSGVIDIGDGSRLVERLEQLLPVDAQVEGTGIRLVARRRD